LVSPIKRSGLRSKRSSTRSIIVLAALISSVLWAGVASTSTTIPQRCRSGSSPNRRRTPVPMPSPLRRRIGQRDIHRRVLLDLGLIQGRQIFAHRATERLPADQSASAPAPPLTVGISFTRLASMANLRHPPDLPSRIVPAPARTRSAACRCHGNGHVGSWRTSSDPAPGLPSPAGRTNDTQGSGALPRIAAARTGCRSSSHDQHPNEQLRINRGRAGMAVVRGQVLRQLIEVKKLIDSRSRCSAGT